MTRIESKRATAKYIAATQFTDPMNVWRYCATAQKWQVIESDISEHKALAMIGRLKLSGVPGVVYQVARPDWTPQQDDPIVVRRQIYAWSTLNARGA